MKIVLFAYKHTYAMQLIIKIILNFSLITSNVVNCLIKGNLNFLSFTTKIKLHCFINLFTFLLVYKHAQFIVSLIFAFFAWLGYFVQSRLLPFKL